MKAKANGLQIVTRQVSALIPYARNPRRNDAVVDRMAASIREYGFKVPILARSDGTVIDGHLRLKAAQKLGIVDIPVILCDEWTEAQVKAFRLMANRSAAWAEWDNELLALELKDLQEMNFDLELTGFDPPDLTEILYGPALKDSEEESIVPGGEANILVKLSFPSAVWLGKRDEIKKVFERMEKTYLCNVRIEE